MRQPKLRVHIIRGSPLRSQRPRREKLKCGHYLLYEPSLTVGLLAHSLKMLPAVSATCLFCKVASGEVSARLVFEDEISLAFLDHRPVFPGHCLLIPKQHFETLSDLPENLIGPFFRNAQLLS